MSEIQIIQDYTQISSDGVWSVQLQETNITSKIHSNTLFTLNQKYSIICTRNWQGSMACTNVHIQQLITLCNCAGCSVTAFDS